MIGCGTETLIDPEAAHVKVPGARINLVLTGRYESAVCVTWANMHRLCLARCRESAPRIALVALASGPVVVSFPIRHTPPPVWSGVEMRPGEIVLHSSGDHFYQRTNGAGCWGLISLAPKHLADVSQALAHTALASPSASKILRPPSKLCAELLRLHAQVCRLVETKPGMIARHEVVRAIEEDLLYLLVNCLTNNEARHAVTSKQRRAEIMARFEQILVSPARAPRSIPEIGDAIGVPERTLQNCCRAFLGISAGRYARLRRFNLIRTALRRADPATASVGAIAKQYGFSELGRFAGAYRTIYGETPSATLRKSSYVAEFA